MSSWIKWIVLTGAVPSQSQNEKQSLVKYESCIKNSVPLIRLNLKGKRPPIFGGSDGDCDPLHWALLWGSEQKRRVGAGKRRTLSLSSEVSRKEVHVHICVCAWAPIATQQKGQRKLQHFKCFRHPNSVCGGKYVNTLLIKRSGIANATARSRPGALLMEGLGHRRSRLEWRVPRGWERRADPWRTTSACRPLTMLTVMNGESCLCISTIIYSQTAERANASHQGRRHSLLFASHRHCQMQEAGGQENEASRCGGSRLWIDWNSLNIKRAGLNDKKNDILTKRHWKVWLTFYIFIYTL